MLDGLREIGYKKEVSSYVTDLKSASLFVSSDAVKALGELGPEATEALPALIDLIRDRGSLLRRDAVIALSKIGPRGSEAVAPLVQALSGEDDVTIIPFLVIAIGRMGPEAKEAVPILMGIVAQDDEAAVRQLSRKLKEAGSKEAVPPHSRKMLVEYQVGLRAAAIHALGRIGPAAKEAVPAITQALEDPNENVREEASQALSDIDPESRLP